MSGQKAVTPTAKGLEASAKAAGKGGLPPVHLWNPPYCGDLDIRIHRDGSWSYLGSPINRVELVRLFSSILKLEEGRYYLVTPVEKVGITVEDAPFVAVDFEVDGSGRGQVLTFVTQVGDRSAAGADNAIRVEQDPATGEPSPYVHVRAGLEALIDRKSFYRLMELGEIHDGWFGLWSGGRFFAILPEDGLESA
ncbi:DUF1285 domain-containing protein [Epibacterium sp. MM17-32]|uniref:DUF1285 domain-containing protein n=1 Tax=Epibacterium sp. MM17-32 TaxID=2917734 RepID=UPI001EF5D370|nr:DUF1285 domain-containing protein [Epibacterium sp. MM17-32]MCG7629593.1 DUF1285 domain-containing protein [Epibacterium sp. MM17-32]